LALTRSTYHLVWVLGAALFVALACRSRIPARRLAVVLLPLVLVPGLYVKNLVLFGTFTGSTWLGMNLAHITLNQAGDEDLRALVADGTLPRRVLIPPFSPLSRYRDDGLPPDGVAVLDQETAQGGLPNFNNRRYIEISDRYLADSLAYLRVRPGEYASAVGAALRFALLPASDYPFVDRNRAQVHGLDRFASAALGLQVRPFDDRVAILYPERLAPSWLQVSWTAALAYLATIAVGPIAWLAQLARLRRRGVGGQQDRPGAVDLDGIDGAGRAAPALDRAALLTLLFVGATVAFASLSGVLLEIGENNRFRFETDPLVLVATTTLVVHAAAARRRSLRAGALT